MPLTAILPSAAFASEQAPPIVWEQIYTATNGEIYSVDPASISDTKSGAISVKSVTLTVDNFKGPPDADHLWANAIVRCEKPAYRFVLAIGSRKGSEALIAMPLAPEGQWTLAYEGSPMAKIMEKACMPQ
jgi:hypothetical protein